MGQPLLLDLAEEFRSPRMLLRTYRAGDGPALWDAIEESREHIDAWLPWGALHKEPDDSEAYARRSHARWLTREDFSISLWDAGTGRFLGGVGWHPKNWAVPSFEVGYWLRKSAEGQGCVREAVELVTGILFHHVGAERAYIRCAIENHRSNAVPRRLGWLHEGVMRSEIRLVDGRVTDANLYSMTRALLPK